MSLLNPDIKELSKSWPLFEGIVSVPHSRRQYNKMVKYLDFLIDEIGNDQNHPLASLLETIGTLIETFEDKFIPEPCGDPVGVLKLLMKEHDLKQKDMKEIGSQGIVSEILNGKRHLNTRQIQALSKRFNVSTAVFI